MPHTVVRNILMLTNIAVSNTTWFFWPFLEPMNLISQPRSTLYFAILISYFSFSHRIKYFLVLTIERLSIWHFSGNYNLRWLPITSLFLLCPILPCKSECPRLPSGIQYTRRKNCIRSTQGFFVGPTEICVWLLGTVSRGHKYHFAHFDIDTYSSFIMGNKRCETETETELKLNDSITKHQLDRQQVALTV
jgi:hypothetical protein